MSEYSALLKSPMWQKKRLDILNKNGFKCEECGDYENNQLHVHHGYYEKGKKPWEYPDCCYHVLCSDCHLERHKIESNLKKRLSFQGLIGLEAIDGILEYHKYTGQLCVLEMALKKGDINNFLETYGSVK